jgi:Tfp pilus assembly PilM family ATPase
VIGTKTVSLDFEGRDIRLLVSTPRRVLRWASVTLPPELMDHGLIQAPDRVGQGLARMLASQKAPRRRVISSTTGFRSVSRTLTMPAVKPSLLDEAVQRKIRQEMPLSADETYSSWQVIGREDGTIRVFALVLPRLVIDRQMEAMRAARLRPRTMDLRPLALVRAVNQDEAIIADFEEQSFGVVIVSHGIPEIIRSVSQPDESVDVKEKLDRLVLELTRTIQFFNDSHRDHPVRTDTPIYVSGSAFESTGMRKVLAERAARPVELPQPPLRLPKDFPLATYCTCLGLAIKKV